MAEFTDFITATLVGLTVVHSTETIYNVHDIIQGSIEWCCRKGGKTAKKKIKFERPPSLSICLKDVHIKIMEDRVTIEDIDKKQVIMSQPYSSSLKSQGSVNDCGTINCCGILIHDSTVKKFTCYVLECMPGAVETVVKSIKDATYQYCLKEMDIARSEITSQCNSRSGTASTSSVSSVILDSNSKSDSVISEEILDSVDESPTFEHPTDKLSLSHCRANKCPVEYQRWFHGALSTQDSEKLLSNKPGGLLVRLSNAHPNLLVLSINRQGAVEHQLLELEDNKIVKQYGKHFENIFCLIDYEIKKNGCSIIPRSR